MVLLSIKLFGYLFSPALGDSLRFRGQVHLLPRFSCRHGKVPSVLNVGFISATHPVRHGIPFSHSRIKGAPAFDDTDRRSLLPPLVSMTVHLIFRPPGHAAGRGWLYLGGGAFTIQRGAATSLPKHVNTS